MVSHVTDQALELVFYDVQDVGHRSFLNAVLVHEGALSPDFLRREGAAGQSTRGSLSARAFRDFMLLDRAIHNFFIKG